MAITTTWNLVSTEVATSPINGLEGVITLADYEVLSADDSAPAVVGRTYGQASLSPPDPANFVAQDQVTKALVLGWVKIQIGAKAISDLEAGSLRMLQNLTAPPTETFIPAG